MGNKKSLGSSPIGFQSGDSALNFIPDLGVSSEHNPSSGTGDADSGEEGEPAEKEKKSPAPDHEVKKKIVSYYLEERLISDLKGVADDRGVFYSTVVSWAVKEWLQRNGSNQNGDSERKPFPSE